jgi:hypothetical protein
VALIIPQMAERAATRTGHSDRDVDVQREKNATKRSRAITIIGQVPAVPELA